MADLELLDEFQAKLRAELGLSDAPIDVTQLLDMTGVVARQVVRPGAPIAAYIVGMAAGAAWAKGEDAAAALTSALAKTVEVADNWQ